LTCGNAIGDHQVESSVLQFARPDLTAGTSSQKLERNRLKVVADPSRPDVRGDT
jgi:hypothetical protein